MNEIEKLEIAAGYAAINTCESSDTETNAEREAVNMTCELARAHLHYKREIEPLHNELLVALEKSEASENKPFHERSMSDHVDICNVGSRLAVKLKESAV